MTTDHPKPNPFEKVEKPARPHEHRENDLHEHPDQERFEPEQDHHEHGNLPQRPGRPGTT